MTEGELKRSLELSLTTRSLLGPGDPAAPHLEVPASLMREVLLAVEEGPDSGWMRLQRVRVVGELDLSGCEIYSRISMQDCVFEGGVDFTQAQTVNLELTSCSFKGPLVLNQAGIRWNLVLSASEFAAGISLYDAKIGGHLVFTGISCAPAEGGTLAIAADDVEVGTDLFCEQANIKGVITLVNARIGGQCELIKSILIPPEEESTAFNGDGMTVGGGIFAEGLEVVGEVRMIDASIDGVVSLADATLVGRNDGGREPTALSADRANLSGTVRAPRMKVTGAVKMLSIKVGGQLSLDGAAIDGEFLLLGGKIAGEVGLANATLDGKGRPALSADRIEVGGGVFCPGLRAKGELRLLGAKIGGQLVVAQAKLSGAYGLSSGKVALNVTGMSTSDAVLCQQIEVEGTLVFTGATVKGGITFYGAQLKCDPGERILMLLGTHADELVLRLAEADGIVDLRYANVRTLWDGEDGDAERLKSLRLEGFSYQAFAVPLDAERRLEWIEASQGGQYLPGVYVGLADAFRRIGHRRDARKVEIEAAHRAIDQLSRWRPRWLWNKLLWITTGSGYRNWLAGIWLLALLAIGSLLFWHCQDTFVPLMKLRPDFNPILYAVDATIPVIEVGQQRAFAPTGWLRWFSLFLTASGYALVTAVVAAAAGLLNPDQRA